MQVQFSSGDENHLLNLMTVNVFSFDDQSLFRFLSKGFIKLYREKNYQDIRLV